MASTWQQQAIDRFFAGHPDTTPAQCNDAAKLLTGTISVENVSTPGSMSYTVVCGNTVVSFREPGGHIDEAIVELARTVHGPLVPTVTQHQKLELGDLTVYTMPVLPGISALDGLDCEVVLDKATEAKHILFVQHLAQYCGRCWDSPQSVPGEAKDQLKGIQDKLSTLRREAPMVLPPKLLSKLEDALPGLFLDYPFVLTHGDLTPTNILVDPDTLEITGIIDWSSASVQPFGLELSTLYLVAGYMDLGGWHDYSCKEKLHTAFWDEFWRVTNVKQQDRQKVRKDAENAAAIGAILRHAFQRNADGSPAEDLLPGDAWSWKYLSAWFTEE